MFRETYVGDCFGQMFFQRTKNEVLKYSKTRTINIEKKTER